MATLFGVDGCVAIRADGYEISDRVNLASTRAFCKRIEMVYVDNTRNAVYTFEVSFANDATIAFRSKTCCTCFRIALDFGCKALNNALTLFVGLSGLTLAKYIEDGRGGFNYACIIVEALPVNAA